MPSGNPGNLSAEQLERWIQAAQQGDKQAFDCLMQLYRPRLHRSLKKYPLEAGIDAEDIVQEVAIKAFLALPQFQAKSQLYTWLYRIALNTVRDHMSGWHQRVYPAAENDTAWEEQHAVWGDSGSQTPDNILMRDEMEQLLFQLIHSLPPAWQTAWVKRELDTLSYEEIAKLCDCPVGTVRSRIARARAYIDAHLAQYLAPDQPPVPPLADRPAGKPKRR